MSEAKTLVHTPKFEILLHAMEQLIEILQTEIDLVEARNFIALEEWYVPKKDIIDFLENQRSTFKNIDIKQYYSAAELKVFREKSDLLVDISQKNAVALKVASSINLDMIDTITKAVKKMSVNGSIYSAKGKVKNLHVGSQSYGYGGEV